MLSFEGPEDAPHGVLAHFRDGHNRLKDNSEHRILSLFRQAGFVNVRNSKRRTIRLGAGRIVYYRAAVTNSVAKSNHILGRTLRQPVE